MSQIVEATIDSVGHVILRKKVSLKGTHNAVITILNKIDKPEKSDPEWSIFGSVEIIDDDLEGASREISEMLNRSMERSGDEVNKVDK